MTMPDREPVSINLALLDTGPQGAFAWGVLDRLLNERWLRIDGISATSAGAMSAAVLVTGLLREGRVGGKRALERFWHEVSDAAMFSPFKKGPIGFLTGALGLDFSSPHRMPEVPLEVVSPYDSVYEGPNPLRQILDEMVGFKWLQDSSIRLFVGVAHARTGRPRIFRNGELSSDVLLASACMPSLFQAVEIDGEPYWCAGSKGYPVLAPLVSECEAVDTLLVQAGPLKHTAVLWEKAWPGGEGDGGDAVCTSAESRWESVRMHYITSDSVIELTAATETPTHWDFLRRLRDEGRRTAEDWLREHATDIGVRSSFEVPVIR